MQISTIAKLIHAPTEEHALTVLIHSHVNVLLATLAPTAMPVSMRVLFRSGVACWTCPNKTRSDPYRFLYRHSLILEWERQEINIFFVLCVFSTRSSLATTEFFVLFKGAHFTFSPH